VRENIARATGGTEWVRQEAVTVKLIEFQEIELEEDIWSLALVSMCQGQESRFVRWKTAESAGANMMWICAFALITLALQLAIISSIFAGQLGETSCFGEAEFTEKTLVEVTVPTARNGSQPWLVRNGDMEYNVLKHDKFGKPKIDDNTIFDWESERLFWTVPNNHPLYHTHAKAFDGEWSSWTRGVSRVLAMLLFGLSLGRECTDLMMMACFFLSTKVVTIRQKVFGWLMVSGRLLTTVYTFVVTFFIILRSETTLDIRKDVLAVGFIVEIDSMMYVAMKKGVLGTVLKKIAKETKLKVYFEGRVLQREERLSFFIPSCAMYIPMFQMIWFIYNPTTIGQIWFCKTPFNDVGGFMYPTTNITILQQRYGPLYPLVGPRNGQIHPFDAAADELYRGVKP
jgi:hypothetical protein